MILPYNVDVPMARMPLANWAVIAVTSLVSLGILGGMWSDPASRSRGSRDNPWHNVPVKNIPPEELNDYLDAVMREAEQALPPLALKRNGFSLVQLVSYLFVHADLLHLIGNMIFLFVFGNAVNAKLGHGLFIGFYLLLGALAGGAWLVMSTGPALVGASGAIMGLVGVFFVLFPRNDVQILYMFSLLWTGTFRVSAYWVILFYMGCDLYGTLRGEGAVAYVAHLAGGVGGMASAFALVAWGWVKPARGEENLLQVLGLRKKRKTHQEELWEAKKELRKKRG
ncbi:MAG TPA: rhomboid family intramembrane serine protease [Gemmataceae bacterium]|jgi:membrane associated rhomboid family serine protease|nr:rhomboid family intramembrane serine protease [Gemmataceae bacterium]